MKKLLFSTVAILAALSALAQSGNTVLKELEDRDGVVTISSSDGIVDFNILSHVGYGINIMSSDIFDKSVSEEFMLNIAQVSINPTEHFCLELNADLNVMEFGSSTTAFVQNGDHKVIAGSYSAFGDVFDKTRSTIRVFSASFPVLLKAKLEGLRLGAGAEAFIPFAGRNTNLLEVDNRKISVLDRKAATGNFNYAFIATVSYSDMGIYFKYFPKGSAFLAEGSVPLDFFTVGIALGF